MTFTRFAVKQTDGPWGDVAMDLRADPQVKRTWGYKRLAKHLNENHKPVERVWIILEQMNVSYEFYIQVRKNRLVDECEFCGEDEDGDEHPCIPERGGR